MKEKKLIFLETGVECPNCRNFLLEKIKLPSESCKETGGEDALLFGKRVGYYCSECGYHFPPNLRTFSDPS